MGEMVYSLHEIIDNVYVLVSIIVLLVLLFSLSFLPYFSKDYLNSNIITFRSYLLSLILLIMTTIFYWFIDTHVLVLPDPVLPYVFYFLLFAIYFGWKISAFTAVFTTILIEYYLFKPRYDLNIHDHLVSSIFAIGGTIVSLYIGYKIRNYQLQLLQNTEDLKKLIKARDQFASIAAHDLKTPLTTIKLYAQNIDKKYAPGDAGKRIHGAVDSIDKETDKLLTMVNRLLDFSKLEAGKYQIDLQILSLNKICRETIKKIKAIHKDHKFIYTEKVLNAKATIDQISLERVLTNLLTNSAKYSQVQTKIELILAKKKGNYFINVKDHGDGISKANLEKIFDPFFQSSDANQGLGLGLFISKKLVEMQNGEISVVSTVGKGTTFSLRFPKPDSY